MLKLTTREDLEALHINQVQESTSLEYKASASVENNDSRKNEIAKDISAMANANGGQFVYGMTEANHLPAGLDGGVPSSPYNGLWFEQVIQQNVRPQIEGLHILPIPADNGSFFYVVTVPASKTIHQTKDGRYYRRRNFRNDIMEDYEIREGMTRAQPPEPYVDIKLPESAATIEWDSDDNHSLPVTLDARVGNRSNTPALYTYITLFLDAELVLLKTGASGMVDTRWNDGHPMKALNFPIITPNHFPLFKETTFSLGTGTMIAIAPAYRMGDSYYRIAYEISTPGYRTFVTGEILKRGRRLTLRWNKQAV